MVCSDLIFYTRQQNDKSIISNTSIFCYRGSCIPVKPMYIHGQLEQVVPSFYDEIIILPAVVAKVEAIQASLMDILKMIFNYLSEWKSYRTVWKYDKQMTCAQFLVGSPTCKYSNLYLSNIVQDLSLPRHCICIDLRR